MKIDWQSYQDGSLSEDERVFAERKLQSDESARRELAGLTTFLQDVRSAALQEDVPLARLAALIPTPEQAPRRSFWTKFALTGGLLAAAVTAVFLMNRPPQIDFNAGYLATTDPVVATKWASKKLGKTLPIMDMGQDAPLKFVHEGASHCCFDYEINGRTYHVNIEATTNRKFQGNPVELGNGHVAMVGQGVRWAQDGYDLYVVGPDAETSVDLAKRASKLLQRA